MEDIPKYQNATLNDLLKVRELLVVNNGPYADLLGEEFDEAIILLDQVISELKAEE